MKKLTFIQFILFVFLSFSLFYACAGDTAQNKKAVPAKTAKKKKAKQNGQKIGGKKVKSNYWLDNKAELKLTDQQLKKIRLLNQEVKQKKSKLPKVGGKPDPKQTKALNAYQQQKLKEILTPAQIKKRAEIDKRRRTKKKGKANNNKKKAQ